MPEFQAVRYLIEQLHEAVLNLSSTHPSEYMDEESLTMSVVPESLESCVSKDAVLALFDLTGTAYQLGLDNGLAQSKFNADLSLAIAQDSHDFNAMARKHFVPIDEETEWFDSAYARQQALDQEQSSRFTGIKRAIEEEQEEQEQESNEIVYVLTEQSIKADIAETLGASYFCKV